MPKFELKKLKIKNTRWTNKYFFLGGFWGFVLNDSKKTMTVLKPTDKSLDYFHLINIYNNERVVPICGPISRLELSGEFDFNKPKFWT